LEITGFLRRYSWQVHFQLPSSFRCSTRGKEQGEGNQPNDNAQQERQKLGRGCGWLIPMFTRTRSSGVGFPFSNSSNLLILPISSFRHSEMGISMGSPRTEPFANLTCIYNIGSVDQQMWIVEMKVGAMQESDHSFLSTGRGTYCSKDYRGIESDRYSELKVSLFRRVFGLEDVHDARRSSRSKLAPCSK